MQKPIFFLLICAFLCSCDYSPPEFWPANGTEIKRIKWLLPLKDSLNVLKKNNEKWILPKPSDTMKTQFQTSFFRTPELNQYSEFLGRIDQEVIHSTQPNTVEFYRFEVDNVLFLGFITLDTNRPLVMFDPPLVVLPGNVFNIENDHESSGTMKTLDKTNSKLSEGNNTKLTLRKIDSGYINSEEELAMLFEMKIVQDKTIQFGETGLLVPEAVLLKSNLLIGRNGTILEWETKSRELSEESKIEKEFSVREQQMEEREYHIEITKNL